MNIEFTLALVSSPTRNKPGDCYLIQRREHRKYSFFQTDYARALIYLLILLLRINKTQMAKRY